MYSLVLASLTSVAVAAEPNLGFVAGGSVPFSDAAGAGGAYGFYTDLPLINTFTLTPSATAYGMGPGGAVTDLDLAFKFIVPMFGFEPFFGVATGPTVGLTKPRVHLGGFVGASKPVVSNLSLLAKVDAKWLITEPEPIPYTHLLVGGAFAF